MKKTGMEKLNAITPTTLTGGIDIAKHDHWIRFTDYRGIEQGRALKFQNNISGFEMILTNIRELCKERKMDQAIIGMEPTGAYWKALAWYLKEKGIRVVLVNPAHTKKSKELDDNSQTKNDKKDSLVIVKLVKDGRYFDTYLPKGEYAELRELTNSRNSIVKMINGVRNQATCILDEYFPEYTTVFKKPFDGKTSLQVLKRCPFPAFILELGTEGILSEIRTAVKRTIGKKKAVQLVETARVSVGVKCGLDGANIHLQMLLEQFELLMRQLTIVEEKMSKALQRTGYSEILLSIKGSGVVSLSSFLGEIGDPTRFEDPKQIHRLAGFNLIENSSGKNKSGTTISKRGRSRLRALLYLMAMGMIKNNHEMKQLYQYLRKRQQNPLKGKQAMIVVAKKIATVIYALIKKRETYKPELVFGNFRMKQLKLVA